MGEKKIRRTITLIVALAVVLVSISGALAADTGWKNPSANAADTGGDGDGFEVNPANAYSDGVGVANNIDNSISGEEGDRHRYYNYGFSIPTGSTIDGIEVRLDWYLDSNYGTNSMDVELSWDGGTSWTTAQTDSTETTTEHTTVLGGSTDTWGRSWSSSDFSDANFRVRLTCNSRYGTRDFYLDWVPVKVYYTFSNPVHSMTFVSHTFDGTYSTWTYSVTSGYKPAISHWVITWCNADALVECSEACEYVIDDPEKTGLTGIKFDKGYTGGESRIVSFTLLGDWPEDSVKFGIKAGSDVVYGWVTGPVCEGLPECSITCDPADCAVCEGDSVTLTEEVGGDAVSWLWSTGETTQSITVTTSGTYSVTVTDANGRSNICTKEVTVYELPTCSISCSPSCAVCEGETVTLTEDGGDAVSWLWSTGAIMQSIDVTTSGTHSVTVTDANGCEKTCQKEVTVYALPTCHISCSPSCAVCEGETVTLTEDGGDTVSWLWSTGATTQSIDVTTSGTYSVTVTDANGYENTCWKEVTVYALPPCEITAPDAVCENSEGNSASTTAGYSSYTWSLSAGTITAGQGTNSITWTAPSHTASPVTVTVTVIDAYGCEQTCQKDVTITPVIIAPGISVKKTADPTSGAPFTNVTFTITVTNTGDCMLDPVTVVDTLPGGMSYVSSSPAGSRVGNTITWNVGPLASGAFKTITLVAHIDAGASGTLENVVCVTGTPPEGADVHDCDTADIEVEVLAPTIEPPQQTLIDITTDIKCDRTVIEEEQFGWETGNGNLLNNPPLAPGEAVGSIKYDEKMIGLNGTTEFTKCFNVNTNVTPNLDVTKTIGYKSGDLGSLSYAEQVGMRYSGASPPLSSNTKCEEVEAYSDMVVTNVRAATETEVGITETDERSLLYEIDAEGTGTVSAGVDAFVEDERSADASASRWTYEEKSIGYGNFTFRKEIEYTSKPP